MKKTFSIFKLTVLGLVGGLFNVIVGAEQPSGLNDPIETIDRVMQKAEKGDVAAMLHLASSCMNGTDVKKDEKKAADLWTNIVRSGTEPEAQREGLFGKALFIAAYSLGSCFYQGIGVAKQDAMEAIRLWKLAAEIGIEQKELLKEKSLQRVFATVIYHLGVCFLDGICIKQNQDIAIGSFTLAARLGNKDALYNLKVLESREKKGSSFYQGAHELTADHVFIPSLTSMDIDASQLLQLYKEHIN